MNLSRLVLGIALLSFAITGVAKKGGGNGDGKPGEGEDVPINAAFVLASAFRRDNTDVYVVDVGGTLEKRISRASKFWGQAMPTVWSADATKFIWTPREDLSIHLSNPDGTGEQIIVPATEEMYPWIGGQRNLAPADRGCDGSSANLLYFLGQFPKRESGMEEMFVVDLDDPGASIQLTDNQSERFSTIALSPDGRLIATWAFPSPGHSWSEGALQIRDACDPETIFYSWTASDLGQVEGFVYFARIDWSVTDLLAVSGHEFPAGDGYDDLWLIDLNVENPVATKIIGDGTGFGEGADNRRPTWSPDGTKLAFVSSNQAGASDYDLCILDTTTGEISNIGRVGEVRDLDWRSTWAATP